MKKAVVISLCLALIVLSSFRQEKKKVLIIGDSISIGYTPYVQKHLENEALVVHNKGNAQHTGTGLRLLKEWLGATHWDVIHFNWGLWDLCYRNPQSKKHGKRDKTNGTITYTVEQYAANLDTLVSTLKGTGATLIFATTTVVPPNEAGRFEGDEIKYNKAALAVMKKYHVAVNDLHAFSIDVHKKHGKGDGDVHYTEKGYKQLAKPVIDAIQKALE